MPHRRALEAQLRAQAATAQQAGVQALLDKRNEAFEIMTNFLEKLADNRSSVVGNMRQDLALGASEVAPSVPVTVVQVGRVGVAVR